LLRRFRSSQVDFSWNEIPLMPWQIAGFVFYYLLNVSPALRGIKDITMWHNFSKTV